MDPARDPPPRALGRGRRLLFSLVAITIFLGLFELVLRVTGYGPKDGLPPPTVTGYFWLKDAHLGWRNRPDGAYRMSDFAGHPVVTSDAHGLRNGHGWATRGERDLVGMFGDSTTFCAEVADEDTAASVLAKVLGDERGVAFLNAGVRGYNTLQVERELRRRLEEFPRIRVAVYTYVPNDYVENRMPRTYWPLVAPSAQWSDGRLVEVEASGSEIPEGVCGADHFARREQEERAARPVWTWVRTHCAVVSFFVAKWGDLQESARWKRDGHPGAEGRRAWAPWAKETGADECLRALLGKMKRTCDERGVKLLVTGFVTRKDDPDLAPLWDACRAQGVPWFDVAPAFTEPETAYVARHDTGRYDYNHYSAHGAETFARALAPAIRDLLPR